MPRMQKILARSRCGTLRSIDPPITVPAWAVMFSGVDPGTLGLYGFRHRRPGTYFEQYVPTSRSLGHPMLWDHLSRAGRRVCVIGMPPGFPPPHVNGVYVSDFLTPGNDREYVFPASVQPEVERAAGGYAFDVRFRADDRERVGRELIELTRKHFAAARYLWTKEAWDLFALHEIGPDRLHHALWKFLDPRHQRFEDRSDLRSLAEEYYTRLDAEIGSLLDLFEPEVRVLFVSDHGSQAMTGCFCINEWLIQHDYLALRGPRPSVRTPLEQVSVDWERTRAWAAGGYYARLFLNVKDREPNGVLRASEVPSFVRHLTEDLGGVRGPEGEPLGVSVLDPRKIYRQVQGDPPDLMLYFGNLAWRSAGTVGPPDLFLAENDTGPDDSVHSFDGLYAVVDPTSGSPGPGPTTSLIDIGPTLLRAFGVDPGPGLDGKALSDFL
jgi:predicted AlkP superfamily phosphohydrolase/phosphomutase